MNSSSTQGTSRRKYNQFVARESIEDYSLRYTPASFRKWSGFTISNTALGGISFLALEAHRSVLKALAKAIDEYDFEEALVVFEELSNAFLKENL